MRCVDASFISLVTIEITDFLFAATTGDTASAAWPAFVFRPLEFDLGEQADFVVVALADIARVGGADLAVAGVEQTVLHDVTLVDEGEIQRLDRAV